MKSSIITEYHNKICNTMIAYRFAKHQVRSPRYNNGKALAECKRLKAQLRKRAFILHSILYFKGITDITPIRH